MIKVITVPLSLPWEYKGQYMRCRSHAFILPINLMKYLWDHDKHNITKQVKVQLCVVFCTVISEAAGSLTLLTECKYSLTILQCFKIVSWFKCLYII